MLLFIRPSLDRHNEYATKEILGYPGWGGDPERNIKGYVLN